MIKMGMKELIKNGHFEKRTIKNLKKCYDYIYKCSLCKKHYGSDKKEIELFLCPICTEERL